MIRVLLFLSIVAFNVASFASSQVVAVVSEVKGNAFYSLGGSTKVLKAGMHIPAQTEIFTEVGAQVSLNDYYDHVFYLSGGAHMIVYPNLVELKEGYVWVKSLHFDPVKGPLKVTTANSLIEHRIGEGIISFDTYSSKTQILSIKGDFDFKNVRMEHRYVTVTEGQFSFIQTDYDEGTPRRATPIGYASYKKVTSLFKGVEAFEEEKVVRTQRAYPSTVPAAKTVTSSRGIASVKTTPSSQSSDPFEAAFQRQEGGVPQTTSPSSSAGKITVIKLRDPEVEKQREAELMNFYKSKVTKLAAPKPKKKWKPSYSEKSEVKVTVFGQGKTHAKKASSRLPASVSSSSSSSSQEKSHSIPKKKYRTPASVGNMLPSVKNNAFESEMVNQYKKNMRHDNEVNELIDQLKSIDMDYKKDY